jgi:hypothetical protein
MRGNCWRKVMPPLIAAAMEQSSAQDRLAAVDAAMARAASLARRTAADVTLIAVTKTHGAEAIEPLLAAGHSDFGENRVQEAVAKWPALRERYPHIRLHLIGQLQSNKAADAVELFDVIHSVDRPSLVTALAKAASEAGRSPQCFIQVNLAAEPQKGGCLVPDLPNLIEAVRDAGLPLAGLMGIPPADKEAAPWFALLAELARRHGLAGLSMGMSGDYETAVTIGATHVRVGTALMGERPPIA